MNNEFGIRICSDLDYEEMVADICYNEQTIAMITQEKGMDAMEIEIYLPAKMQSWKLPLDEFLNIIQSAKQRLIDMKKLPE